MIIVSVCVGSSCHLKGSEELTERFNKAIEDNGIGDKVVLIGSFCSGKCIRIGVAVCIDDEVHTGVTNEVFPRFFEETILSKIRAEV